MYQKTQNKYNGFHDICCFKEVVVLGVIFEALEFISVAFWRDLGSLLLILMVLAGSWMAGWMLAGPVVGQRDPRILRTSPGGG